MDSESFVYGVIRDCPIGECNASRIRAEHNRSVLAQLPDADSWPLLGREMFQCAPWLEEAADLSQIIHFGASYSAVEYEWSLWMEAFETLLRRLYWSSAVVHLETELNGVHTFRWDSDGVSNLQEGALRVRCAWEREGAVLM